MKLSRWRYVLILLGATLACTATGGGTSTAVPAIANTACLGRGTVQAAAFSPDGRRLAIATSTSLIFYDAHTLAELQTEDIGTWITALEFSPDGQMLAVAEQTTVPPQYQIRIWQVSTTEGQTALTPQHTLLHVSKVHGLAFSPDGQTLAGADGTVKLWRVSDGRLLQTLRSSWVANHTTVAISPNGRYLVSGGQHSAEINTPTRIWQLPDLIGGTAPDKAMLYTLASASGDEAVAFVPDGLTYLAGSTLYQTDNGQTAGTLPTTFTRDAAFAPNGQWVAGVTDSGSVGLVETATGTALHFFARQLNAHLAISPDGQTLVTTTDDTVWLWDTPTLLAAGETQALRGVLTGFASSVRQVQFMPNGRSVLAVEYGLLRLWDLNGAGQQTFPATRSDFDVLHALSPDGQTLVIQVRLDGGAVQLQGWALQSHSLLYTVDVSAAPFDRLAFSPDGQLLAGASDKALHFYEAQTGTLERTIAGPNVQATQLTFSPDGQWVAANSLKDGAVGVWNVAEGSLKAETGRAISLLRVSTDGRWLATATREQDTQPQIWRSSDGTLAQTLQGNQRNISALAFAPDGQTLASGGGDPGGSGAAVRLWRVADGQVLRTLSPQPNRIADLLFAADGQTLYAASGKTVAVWDVSAENLARQFIGHTSYVYSLALSPDGTQLASGSLDGTVRLWPAR